MSETYDAFVVLSQRQCAIKRAVHTPMGGLKVQEFTPQGLSEVELDAEELRALLLALPTTILLQVLDGVSNPFFDLDEPSERNGLHILRKDNHGHPTAPEASL